ncbi:MAG: ComEC/Rec2 family competence protein [Candidatus Riflebacteria bacterium]|nr:ComEC/Rec2 family competence protein [Candidatus Riflebacteria bacterium]
MSNKKEEKVRIMRIQPDAVVFFTTFFVLGVFFTSYCRPGNEWIFGGISLFLFGTSFFTKNNKVAAALLYATAFFSAAFYGNLRLIPEVNEREIKHLIDSEGVLKGKFTGGFRHLKSGGISFLIENSEYRGAISFAEKTKERAKIPGKIRCHFKTGEELDLLPENYYKIEGKFASEYGSKYPCFIADKVENTFENSYIWGVAGKIREKIKESLSRALPKKYEGIIVGFVLGDTSLISLEDKKLYRETGISHLLAISGQHIMIILLLATSFLSLLRIPPVSRIIIISIGLSFYALITVGSPSVWRALIMYIAAALALHFELFPSPLRPVSLAALTILLYNPNYINDVAFILSFSAVIGIVILAGPINIVLQKLRLPEIITRYFSVSFAANLGTIPLCMYIFGTFSSASIIVNPLILWAFAYIIPLSFFISIVSLIKMSWAIYMAPTLTLVLEGVMRVVEYGASIPEQFIYVGNIPAFVIAGIYCAFLGFAVFMNKMQILDAIRSGRIKQPKPTLIDINDATFYTEKPIEYDSFVYNGEDMPSLQPPARMFYPLKNQDYINQLDGILVKCRRPSVKDLPSEVYTELPLSQLRIENQNIYYLLLSLDKNVLLSDSERVLQSQILIMALVGSEFLARIVSHLNPPPVLSDMKIEHAVKDKNLAIVLISDYVLSSSLLTRTKDRDLMMLISGLQNMFSRGYNQFERITGNADLLETVNLHFVLRHDMFVWCKKFIDFDLETKKMKSRKLRPEI